MDLDQSSGSENEPEDTPTKSDEEFLTENTPGQSRDDHRSLTQRMDIDDDDAILRE